MIWPIGVKVDRTAAKVVAVEAVVVNRAVLRVAEAAGAARLAKLSDNWGIIDSIN